MKRSDTRTVSYGDAGLQMETFSTIVLLYPTLHDNSP